MSEPIDFSSLLGDIGSHPSMLGSSIIAELLSEQNIAFHKHGDPLDVPEVQVGIKHGFGALTFIAEDAINEACENASQADHWEACLKDAIHALLAALIARRVVDGHSADGDGSQDGEGGTPDIGGGPTPLHIFLFTGKDI